MRFTIVIIALIGLLGIAMDTTQEVDKTLDNALLSSQVSLSDSTVAAIALDVDAAERKHGDQDRVHLAEIKGVTSLGVFLLLGVAFAGFLRAPRSKARKSRASRGIT